MLDNKFEEEIKELTYILDNLPSNLLRESIKIANCILEERDKNAKNYFTALKLRRNKVKLGLV